MTKPWFLNGLIEFQPLLDIQRSKDITEVSGKYQINELVYKERFFDNFDVKIIIASNYPKTIPQVFVFGSRLEKCEHRNKNDLLCLETEHTLKAFLKQKPSLKEFLQKFLTPFFLGYVYFEKYGKYLFGERGHGDIGIIEMYQERFDTKDRKLVLDLLEIVARKKYRGHLLCPCKSGKRIRNCHGKNGILINMINSPEHEFYTEGYHYFINKYRKNKIPL